MVEVGGGEFRRNLHHPPPTSTILCNLASSQLHPLRPLHADQIVHLRHFAAQEEQVGRVVDPQQEQEQGDDVRVRGDAVEGGEPGHVERVESLRHLEAERAEDGRDERCSPHDPPAVSRTRWRTTLASALSTCVNALSGTPPAVEGSSRASSSCSSTCWVVT